RTAESKRLFCASESGALKWRMSEGVPSCTSSPRHDQAPWTFCARVLKGVEKSGNRITAVIFENGNRVEAKMFIDASYEGDLMAQAGVSFTIGREDNSKYGETINGFYIPQRNNFKSPLDPYRTPGDPKSGLLPGIQSGPLPEPGTGDKQVQAYGFRMCASDAPDRRPFPKPGDFNRDTHLLLLRYLNSKSDSFWNFAYSRGPMKLNRGDCNNAGPMSIDYVGESRGWCEADYATRERIFQKHVTYQQGLMWVMANDPEVPALVRKTVGKFGLTTEEFKETDGWPHELYVREGRRMISDYVMTQADCSSQRVAPDSVGLGSYMMDSHFCSRIVAKGVVKAQGGLGMKIPKPYPISYRSIVPRESECANLLVPVALSASHVAFSSIRMEPVFGILGQSAGTAAALAIDTGVPVQELDYARLRERLLQDKQRLLWNGEVPAPTKEP
ncbi:MAG: FAD-dependent oxidoreductase, partial [Prosthecobacter sp.]|uniref:FAD-dependent oxidoreductase n=1 Tax=Prosthecobacter sp. TaxID=1965333 RepID=UPI0038FEDDB6